MSIIEIPLCCKSDIADYKNILINLIDKLEFDPDPAFPAESIKRR